MAPRIDRSPYTKSPRGTGRQLMSLGRLLLRYTPSNPPQYVADAAAALGGAVELGRTVYIRRINSQGPEVAAEDREDDGFADSLLTTSRTLLELWEVFDKPTIKRMALTEPADGIDFAALMDKAARARRLRVRLFSAGFDATRAPYAEQAEYMLTLEAMIEGQGLEAELIELMGAPYYTMLRRSIRHYKEMVDRRQSGEGGEAGLREVNIKLQNAIQDYLLALLTSLRDDDPDSVAQVRRALGPVDAFRATLGNRPASGGAQAGEPELDGVDPAAVEEFVAEQEAVDAELGPDGGASVAAPDAGDAEGADAEAMSF